jgi:hypothetical protein
MEIRASRYQEKDHLTQNPNLGLKVLVGATGWQVRIVL